MLVEYGIVTSVKGKSRDEKMITRTEATNAQQTNIFYQTFLLSLHQQLTGLFHGYPAHQKGAGLPPQTTTGKTSWGEVRISPQITSGNRGLRAPVLFFVGKLHKTLHLKFRMDLYRTMCIYCMREIGPDELSSGFVVFQPKEASQKTNKQRSLPSAWCVWVMRALRFV